MLDWTKYSSLGLNPSTFLWLTYLAHLFALCSPVFLCIVVILKGKSDKLVSLTYTYLYSLHKLLEIIDFDHSYVKKKIKKKHYDGCLGGWGWAYRHGHFIIENNDYSSMDCIVHNVFTETGIFHIVHTVPIMLHSEQQCCCCCSNIHTQHKEITWKQLWGSIMHVQSVRYIYINFCTLPTMHVQHSAATSSCQHIQKDIAITIENTPSE